MTGHRLVARAELYEQLKLARTRALILDHVPSPGDVPRVPGGVLILYTGADGSYFDFDVQIYVSASDPDVETAQQSLLETIDAIDMALHDATTGLPVERVIYAQALDAWVGTITVRMPRNET